MAKTIQWPARTGWVALIFSASCCVSQAAWAGLFEDDDARKAILDLRAKVEANAQTDKTSTDELRAEVEQLKRGMLQLNGQIEQLRQSLAQQRGLDEQLARDVAELQRKQKDSSQNLDERLRQFERGKVSVDGQEFVADPTERRLYETALQQFRRGDFVGAELGFVDLIKRYPKTGYLATSMFWLANAQFAIRHYKDAIANFQTMLRMAPEHPKAPEAMLSIANCKTELKDAKGARKTLEELRQKYPQSEAAVAAAERLKNLK
jgi:tol-pal system protein YbgF